MARDPTIPVPPPLALRHRTWRIWYDPGEVASGQCVRETRWRAKHRSQDQLEAHTWNDILRAVDAVEDMRGGPTEPRLPFTVETNAQRSLCRLCNGTNGSK